DHVAAHHARQQIGRGAGQPGSGRHRQVRREAGLRGGVMTAPVAGAAGGPDQPPAGAVESVERAVSQIAAGRPVVVVDDEDRENEGDLVFAAELATPELLAFLVRYTSGYVCVPMTAADCDRLDLPPM